MRLLARQVANRDRLRMLVTEYRALLDQGAKEQVYQSFIERNTELIPREFLMNHGVWCDLVFRKLRLGSSYICDFAFVTKGSMRWRLVLVEIERPDKQFFRRSTLRLHSDFARALEQVSDWRSFLNRSPIGFVTETLGAVATFPQIVDPGEVKFVLVYGRRREFESNPMRRAKIAAQETEDLRIISFDSLVEDLLAKEELYLAVRRNEFVDVLSDRFISETPFVYLEPENIRISGDLLASAQSALAEDYQFVEFGSGGGQSQALNALSRVRIRKDGDSSVETQVDD